MTPTRIYIRFTSDIYGDLKRGYSIDFRSKERLEGLCAWNTCLDTLVNSEEEIVAECKKKAADIVRNGYGGYSSDSEVAILVAEYAGGSSNDGTLIKNAQLYKSFSL